MATRAAVAAEHVGVAPRFEEYRSGGQIYLARPPSLRGCAVALGQEDGRLAALDPLPTPARSLEELRAIPFPKAVHGLALPSQ